MSFSNPIVLCGLIALAIVFVLVMVVIICCKRNADRERDDLKALSLDIEADNVEETVTTVDDKKIENVLSKMQEALDMQEEVSVSFEEEQEENAIISYQELLTSLGAKSSIDIDSIELYDDELENQVEISDFNKEIIDAYQNESFDREIYRFQNDYSSEGLAVSETLPDAPVMNFDNENVLDNYNESAVDVSTYEEPVYEAKHSEHKFRSSEIISPVYGIMNKNVVTPGIDEDVEMIEFDDDSSLLDEF